MYEASYIHFQFYLEMSAMFLLTSFVQKLLASRILRHGNYISVMRQFNLSLQIKLMHFKVLRQMKKALNKFYLTSPDWILFSWDHVDFSLKYLLYLYVFDINYIYTCNYLWMFKNCKRIWGTKLELKRF